MTNLFDDICTSENLKLAHERARKGKTLKPDVIAFEKELEKNLRTLREELTNGTYTPQPLTTFVIRDPKTRVISKSDYRDRVIHHALCSHLEPMFDKRFIHDSYANRKGKGVHAAIRRYEQFQRIASRNHTRPCYALKCDIRHYFDTVDHDILLRIIARQVTDGRVLALIRIILTNRHTNHHGKGMPLGNRTSQFFANIYLDELDQHIKHHLRAKHYLRYVDDFAILSHSQRTLREYRTAIRAFLHERLALDLHPGKCRIIPTKRGVPLLGFRVFPHHRLLREKNRRTFERKYLAYREQERQGERTHESLIAFLDGWLAYARHASTYKYRRHIIRMLSADTAPPTPKTVQEAKSRDSFAKRTVMLAEPYTAQKTLKLLKQGYAVAQIALKRDLKPATIWSHVAKLIEWGQLPLTRALPKEIIELIRTHIHAPTDRTNYIHARIGEPNITFDEIACVLADMKRHSQPRSIHALIGWYARVNCYRKCRLHPAQRAMCEQQFRLLAQKSPTLRMTQRAFWNLCSNHLTICILSERERRRFVTIQDVRDLALK